jgi:hypothetical protein
MSLSGAEKAGVFGAIVLAGALVASTIILLRPATVPARIPEPGPDTPVAVGTADAGGRDPTPGTTDPEPEVPPDPEEGYGDTKREIERLKGLITKRDNEILRLKGLLSDAGIAFEEAARDPVEVAREAITDLRKCGPETSLQDIDDLLQTLARLGAPAVPEIQRFMELQMDVKYSDTWSVLGGRFLGYPGLRLALIEVLAQIGGVPGESALVGVLRQNEDPLEVCVLTAHLVKVGNVPTVAEVRVDAAKRYLEMTPPRSESLVVRPLLGVLASLHPPEEAANALLAFIRSSRRTAGQVEPAITLLAKLPEEVAVTALTKLAEDPVMGRKGEDAAESLVLWPGGALDALARIVEKGSTGVRRVVYRSLDRTPKLEFRDAKSRSTRSALEALTVLDRLDEDLTARKTLAGSWRETEEDPALASMLTATRERLGDLEKESAELRERLTVD